MHVSNKCACVCSLSLHKPCRLRLHAFPHASPRHHARLPSQSQHLGTGKRARQGESWCPMAQRCSHSARLPVLPQRIPHQERREDQCAGCSCLPRLLVAGTACAVSRGRAAEKHEPAPHTCAHRKSKRVRRCQLTRPVSQGGCVSMPRVHTARHMTQSSHADGGQLQLCYPRVAVSSSLDGSSVEVTRGSPRDFHDVLKFLCVCW